MIYTSYYAVAGKIPNNIIKVSISKGIPSWYHGESYSKLAPFWKTVKAYKDGGSWEEYTREYNDTILSRLGPEEVRDDLMRISDGADVVLLCYEARGNCHRHIARHWLNAAGIECKEYEF